MAYASEVITGTEAPFAKSLRLLESVRDGSLMSVDTESNGFSARLGARITVVSMAWRSSDGVGHAIALPFGQGSGGEKIWAPAGAWELVLEKLAMSMLVMFHSHFDHGMLRAGTMRQPGLDLGAQLHWDGMVAEKIIVGRATGGLKTTAERYNLTGGNERDGEEAIEGWLRARNMDKGDMHKVPWHVMQPYARTDAVLTLRLYEEQQTRLLALSPWVRAQVEAKMSALREKMTLFGQTKSEVLIA